MKLRLHSSAFSENQDIPQIYTGEGLDRSPPLDWSHVPDGTREFALICEDPDAVQEKPWVHWLVYGISPEITQLPEGIVPHEEVALPVRLRQGVNSFGNKGYGGPMPPVGHGSHRYFFKLYALKKEVVLSPNASRTEFLKAIDGGVIDVAECVGRYERTAEKQQKKVS